MAIHHVRRLGNRWAVIQRGAGSAFTIVRRNLKSERSAAVIAEQLSREDVGNPRVPPWRYREV